MNIHVRGGTSAGWRRIKQIARADWLCPGCGKAIRYFWTKCPNCGHPHPEH